MKKLTLLTLWLLLAAAVFAQKITPKLKEGSSMNFNVDYQGTMIDFMLTLKSLGDPIKMNWDVNGTGGSYEMSQKAFESGTAFNTERPTPNGVTTFKESDTFCFISKAAYQSLVKTKAFTYSNMNYTLKDSEPFKVGDMMVDAMHVATADSKMEIWIMNSPDFPMVLKIKGNPNGVDFFVTKITE